MKVRKFLMENEKAQKFDMNNFKSSCLLVSPNNLGYSFSSEFEQIGNSFIENNRKTEKKDPSGVLYFKSYDKYKEFVDFIEKSEQLKFTYIIPFQEGEKIFYRDVSIKELGKSEKTIKMLACPVTFNGLSLWYEKSTAIYAIEPLTNEMRWDFQWDSTFYDYDTRSLEFVNKGHVEAPILVEIDGEVGNPALSLYVEGELKQTIEFTVDIGENEKFLYGSKATDFYIKKQNSNGTIEDLYEYYDDLVLDFANDNVMRLPKNKSCKLVLSADNEITNAKVTILTYYKAI